MRSSPPPTTSWPTNGGNWYNQRYSPLKAIDRGNVAKLKGVWRTRLGGSGVGTKYSGEAQPIVYDGVIYVVTGADDVFAISADSGDILWKYEAKLDDKNDVVCCGWTSRGVALGDGKIFVGQLDGKLVALEQQSRQGRVANPGRTLAGRLQPHGRAALLWRARDRRRVGCRVRNPRPREGIQREDRRAGMDLPHGAGTRRARPRHVAAGQRFVEERRRLRVADTRGRS